MSRFEKKVRMNKTQIYDEARRYKKAWESQFSWVRESPDNERNPYCVFCKVEMQPRKSRLAAHELTKVHIRMMESMGGEAGFYMPVDTELQQPPPPLYTMKVIKEDNDNNSECEGGGDLGTTVFPVVDPVDFKYPSQDGGDIQMIDKGLPAKLYEEVVTQLKTASRSDALWFCKDGCYKVHKVIVASASPFLRQILEQEPGELTSVIFTPDFSLKVIKPIICLLYTGEVIIGQDVIEEVQTAIHLFQMNSDQIIVSSYTSSTNQELTHQKSIMSAMERNSMPSAPPITKRKRKSQYREDSGFDSSVLAAFGNVLDGSDSHDYKCEVFSDEEYDDYKTVTLPPVKKSKRNAKKKGVKYSEMKDFINDDDDEEEDGDSDSDGAPKRPIGRPKKSKMSNGESSPGPNKRKVGPKKSHSKTKSSKNKDADGDFQEDWPDDKENKNENVKKRSWKFLGKADTSEMYRTRGPGKDERCLQLSEALFDGLQFDFIYTCIACYSVFEYNSKLEAHKQEVHPDGVVPGDLHTQQENEFQCPKCRDIIAVKHLAWFCKHVKYCGENNEIANDLITPGEDSSDCDDEAYFMNKKRPVHLKNTPERMMITGGKTGRNMQILSKALTKKLVKFIWGCSLCYTVHLSEESLETHKKEKHQGEDLNKQGSCWNAHSQNYTCPHCKKNQNCRHLVWFIYHMHKCKTAQSGSSALSNIDINAEEDSDEEDNNEDVMDAEGILFRTYKIRGKIADWICEALFGRVYSHLYPCHVCYTVHLTAKELQDHFLATHSNMLNRLENGAYYRKAEQCFNCPICLKNVCYKKTNSIFFTFHFRKCNNQTFPVKKKCPSCSKDLNSYSSYRNHMEGGCETSNVMCHLCTKCFINIATLNHHIKYVHRTDRPFQCHMCDKNYKENCELKVHIKTAHSLHHNYSCEKCGKQFYAKKTLSMHMVTHLPEAERKYGCNMCGKRFSKKKILDNHITTHSEIRHYSCEICGARVKTRDTLKQHRKKVHKIFTPAPKQPIPRTLLHGSAGDPVNVKKEVEDVISDAIDEVKSACASIITL